MQEIYGLSAAVSCYNAAEIENISIGQAWFKWQINNTGSTMPVTLGHQSNPAFPRWI
jgi:hypothetical protein